MVGSIVTAALTSSRNDFQPRGVADLVFGSMAAVNAGVVEEMVALAFVVTTLRQARRPGLEILVIALLLRGSYHIYYGPGVVGILVWAAVFLWLYRRTGSILPLVVVHAAWDLSATIGQVYPHPTGAVAGLTALLLFLAAPVSWLIERSRRPMGNDWAVPPGWR